MNILEKIIDIGSNKITKVSGLVRLIKDRAISELTKTPSEVKDENIEINAELARDGIVVLPHFFNTEQIWLFREVIEQQKYAPTPEMQHSYYNPLADKFLPNAHAINWLEWFFKNSRIDSIIKAYFSSNAEPWRNFIRIKKDTWPTASFENFWHFDSIKNRVKVFLYLTDVNTENAPVAYLRWTHKTWLWKIWKEIEMHKWYQKDVQWYAKDDIAGYIWCFWPHEIEDIKKRYDFKEEVCTYPAWTVIIFDAKWLHKATQLVSGERAILMSHWYIPNQHT